MAEPRRCLVSRSCQTGKGFSREGEGDGISDELVECCRKLLHTPEEYGEASTGGDCCAEDVSLARSRVRRYGASDPEASGGASGGRRSKFMSFLSRLHGGQAKPKQAAQKGSWPRWSARARHRFNKFASWVHALRLALRLPGEPQPPATNYCNPAATEGDKSPFLDESGDGEELWPQDCFQDVPL
ncbi:uncharacterized protein LOC144179921 [Haemaphysalis longicornis]